MKSILLYANDDDGQESRLQSALDLARTFNGHITCLQVTPFDSFILGDPFGGVYALPMVVEEIRNAKEANRSRIEERLKRESIGWTWLEYSGQPAQLVVDRSRLADVIVITLPGPDGASSDGPLGIAGEVAVHARSPVLAAPVGARSLDCRGTALVAWNGAPESSNALRQALPLLKEASAIHMVTVGDDEVDFPATQGCEYLALHGLSPQLHEWPRSGRSVAEAILDSASVLKAAYVVMGAYGHSRLREAVLGGVTREMLSKSPLPLLLGR